MSASHFSPVVDILKPSGGRLRISAGMAAGKPAIMLEVFAKVGKSDKSKAKISLSVEMLDGVLMAMAAAACEARAQADGHTRKPTGWAVVNTDIVEAMQGRGKRERVDG